MLDVNLIRTNPDVVKTGIQAKNADPALVDQFLKLDAEWRELSKKRDDLRAQHKSMGWKDADREAMKKGKEEIQGLEKKIIDIETQRTKILYEIPNIPLSDIPVGKNEDENKVIRTWGEIPKFDFTPKDHVVLGEALDLIDIETASKVAGTRFVYLKNELVRLQYALVQYAFEVLADEKILKQIADKVQRGYSSKPFVPIVPPFMIKPEPYIKMARLSDADKNERYHIPSDDIYLIGSAEHTLGAMHMDSILPLEKLPMRYVGFSPAFRRESGSYGKDTRGILRVHQFEKVEIESFTRPEDSINEQNFIVGIQEYMMQSLEIPYQVIVVCTGDMGKPDIRQIDINSWMPGQNKYRETHTSDCMGDYQARRLGTKYKTADGKSEYVHMNDATVFAIGRTLIAIMENYQTKDGTIKIPKVLQSYVGKKEIKR